MKNPEARPQGILKSVIARLDRANPEQKNWILWSSQRMTQGNPVASYRELQVKNNWIPCQALS
jgi:hypothetical protein